MRGNSAPVEALLGETTTASRTTDMRASVWICVVVLLVIGALRRWVAFARRPPPTTLDRLRDLPKE